MNAENCSICSGFVPATLECSSCPRRFHLQCVGLEKEEWNWSCAECHIKHYNQSSLSHALRNLSINQQPTLPHFYRPIYRLRRASASESSEDEAAAVSRPRPVSDPRRSEQFQTWQEIQRQLPHRRRQPGGLVSGEMFSRFARSNLSFEEESKLFEKLLLNPNAKLPFDE